MRKFKLMADYGCYPLWAASETSSNNLNPEDLNITRELIDSLNQWADDFDATLKMENPLNSDFSSKESEDEFDDRGKLLYQELRQQLDSDYIITYYSIRES